MILEEFLNNNVYKFEWTDCEGIWIDKERSKIAIDTYHLSYFGIYNGNQKNDDKACYDSIVKRLSGYLYKHPDFLLYGRIK